MGLKVMVIDYFEELLKKPSLFRDESKLDINFVPENLPHRDKELSLLSQLFLGLITNKNTISRKILLTGKTGIGKTVTVKLFGHLLERAGKKRDALIKYIHINCRKERTSYKVLIKIIRSIDNNFPKRGYSSQDLLDILIDFLNTNDSHLLIVLDELSYLISNNEDLIYSFTRLNDELNNTAQRVSIIGIVRDLSCLNNLDSSTLSTLQRNIIKFNNYTKDQIFNILSYRAELGLKDKIISDNLIEVITEIIVKEGDIRQGLNLLWKAAKIAENKNLKKITLECIRLANHENIPMLTQDVLNYMHTHKLIFLYSIVKALKNSSTSQIPVFNILKFYFVLCENIGIKNRSYSQLWHYLQEYKKDNIICIKIVSEKIKGRKSFIEIPDIPLSEFEEIIINILSSKGIRI